MKRLIILIPKEQLYPYLVLIAAAVVLSSSLIVKAAFSDTVPAYDRVEEQEKEHMEKENSRMKGVLKNIAPENDQPIYEDQYRNYYVNAKGHIPPSIETVPLPEVLENGVNVKYNVLLDNPGYLRPLYDPEWKGFYFRSWLYLPRKNIDARHRLFVFPGGGSAIYDFTGTLGLRANAAVDYHRNKNILIYGFKVKGIKYYKNQVALTGEPSRRGLQIISIRQDDLLLDGTKEKGILIQLSTPQGYEFDFIQDDVIRFDFLMRRIKENSVSASADAEVPLEQLLDESLYLRKELSYFVPTVDKLITQEMYRPVPPNFPMDPDLKTMRLEGRKIAFSVNYWSSEYRRPAYDPLWLANYKKRWCFIPRQVGYNLHRLFSIPQAAEEQADFFGMLGFRESPALPAADGCSFLMYNFQVDTVVNYEDQIFLVGAPSRRGAEIITISRGALPADGISLVRMVTFDDQELDYAVMQGNSSSLVILP